MYFRELIFGQEQEVAKPHGSLSRIALIAVTLLLLGLAWHYGIITALALIFRDILVAVGNIFSDIAASIGDFLHFVTG